MDPNFFIVGGSKCGTTNISYYLNEHPDVFISKLNEPYYFSRFDVPDNFKRESMITNYKKYSELFNKGKNCKAVGEASSVYLASPHAASEIKKTYPDAKIIISLRNPIERAHSSYFSYQFMHKNEQNFTEIIDEHLKQIRRNEFFIYNILETGFYTKHLKRFQDNFSADKIKIIIFEDYVKNTIPTIESILSFLNIHTKIEFKEQSKGSYRQPKNMISKKLLENSFFRKATTKFVPTVTRQKIGDKLLLDQRKKPDMLESDRRKLKEIYEEEVKKLEEMLKVKLPWNEFCN